jgi:hypothetical protein
MTVLKLITVCLHFFLSFLIEICITIYYVILIAPSVFSTGRGPIIANLHITRERTRMFGPFLADNNIMVTKQTAKSYICILANSKEIW